MQSENLGENFRWQWTSN